MVGVGGEVGAEEDSGKDERVTDTRVLEKAEK